MRKQKELTLFLPYSYPAPDTPQNRKSTPDADFISWVKPKAIADAVYFYCTNKAAVVREPVIKLYGNL